jgi:carbon monoxide dehydrogenase subunit G
MRSFPKTIIFFTALLGVSAIGAAGLVRWARRWGSTADEQAMHLPGDAYLEGGPEARTVMTRAISISTPSEVVWPWLAQMGRGAGWYSYDRIDNGGKASARHVVSWIPSPRVGDAAAIGWLRDLEPGRALTWWLPGEEAFGTTMRMVVDIRLNPEGAGSRLVIRVSGDATGTIGSLVMHVFEAVDSIMAIRQLQGIKARTEVLGARAHDPAALETGDRDQFQLYETIWNFRGTGRNSRPRKAGIAGREKAALWRQNAEAAGVVSL